jgi:hypothetical protein
MKMFLFLLVSAALAFPCGAQTPRLSDDLVVERMIGTWQALEGGPGTTVVGESTYAKDGSVSGFTTRTVKNPDGTTTELTIKMKANWRIEGGVMYLAGFESSPSVVPRGHTQRYEVVSITETKVVFKDLINGSVLIRYRKESSKKPKPTISSSAPLVASLTFSA